MDEIVARCTNFIFVLTDNIFDSPWCMKVGFKRKLTSPLQPMWSLSLITHTPSMHTWGSYPPPGPLTSTPSIPGAIRSQELQAAVEYKVNIILLVKDGARYYFQQSIAASVLPP